ncbi:hypothetical protein BKA70DRAFT_1309125 [Coprinopsis sp. MPI-PUGE-AT-0042]|nr:hypothetical protein BKA70DRAFT_1309125 [Coprinopsis sp. MPI-PUGE-AT-0042]
MFFLWNNIDLGNVFRAHPSLKTVGIYDGGKLCPSHIHRLPSLPSSSLLLAVMWLPWMERQCGHITFFPNLLQDHDDPEELRERLRNGFDPEGGLTHDIDGGKTRNLLECFSTVRIPVEDFRRPVQLKAILTSANISFPPVRKLCVSMGSSDGLFTEKTAKSIEMFNQVYEVSFTQVVEPGGHLQEPHVDVESPFVVAFAKRLGMSMDKLYTIHFGYDKMLRQDNWIPIVF